jgi:outer membrane protein OmpA-like peptidoglycan-associated protein
LVDGIADHIKRGAPVVGADVGVTIPVSKAQKVQDPGGAIAPYAGFEIPLGLDIAFTPIIQPQYAAFGCEGCTVYSITSLTAGARFSLHDENSEAYFGAQGGYYWTTQGPRKKDDGVGWNIQGGYDYEFWRGTGLGVFIAYHDSAIKLLPSSTSDSTQFIVTGIEVQHRFLPPPPAPPPPPVAAAPTPAPVEKKKIVLRGVNFDFDKSNIRPDAVPILDEAAKTLKEYGNVTVSVDGYTDSIGTDAYNQALSLRRATSVRNYLEEHGVPGSRMTVRGFGETNPVASNETPEGRAQNRRVELIVNNQ